MNFDLFSLSKLDIHKGIIVDMHLFTVRILRNHNHIVGKVSLSYLEV